MVAPLAITISWSTPLNTGLANQVEPMTLYTIIMTSIAAAGSTTMGDFSSSQSIFSGQCAAGTVCTIVQSFNASRAAFYFFRAFAHNQLGLNTSAYAEARNQSIDLASSPGGPIAVIAGAGAITVTWTAPTDTGVGDASLPLFAYLVKRVRSNADLSCSCYCASCTDCTRCGGAGECCNVSLSDGGLSTTFSEMPTGPARYYFSVRAVNIAGVGAPSAIANEQSIGLPSSPTSFAAGNPAPLAINLSWASPLDNGTGLLAACLPACRNLTGYQLSCSAIKNGLGVACNGLPSYSLSVSTKQLYIADLDNLVDSYTFGVVALNDAGSSLPSFLTPIYAVNTPTEPLAVTAQIAGTPSRPRVLVMMTIMVMMTMIR